MSSGVYTPIEWQKSVNKSQIYNKKSEFYDFIKQMPLYIERDLPKFGSTVITHTGLMESFLITDANDKIDVLASVKRLSRPMRMIF